jgi:hypothetical protein
MRSWGSEVQEANLARAVAEAVKPYLSAVERDAVFVAIGAGDTYAAIRGLLRSVEIKRIPLRPDLLHQCRTWLRGYGGHDHERDIHRRSGEPQLPHMIGAAATTPLTCVPPNPNHAAGCPSKRQNIQKTNLPSKADASQAVSLTIARPAECANFDHYVSSTAHAVG